MKVRPATARRGRRAGFGSRPWLRRVAVLLALAASLAAVRAWALDPTEQPSDYIDTHWDTETGLPHNAVRAIFQTRDGFLWVGTQQGIARFDGITFTVFNEHNTPGILNSQVTSFAQTDDGSLWIGTSNGLVRLRHGKFRTFTQADGVKSASGTVNAVCVAPDHSLWIGSQDGITRWVNGRFVQDIDTSAFDTHGLRSITVDHTGALWVAAGTEALRYDDGRFTRFGAREGLPAQQLQAVVDAHGTMVAATQDRLYVLDGDRFVPFAKNADLSSPRVATIIADRDGNIWIGSIRGLDRYTHGNVMPYLDRRGDSPGVVAALFEDREGCLWVGSSTGLHRLTNRRGRSWTTSDHITGTLGLAVDQSSDGAIWVSTWGGGVERFRDGTVTHYALHAPLSYETITALYEGPDHVMWLGTRASAVDRLENGRVTTFVYPSGVATSRPVTALHINRDGEFLLGIDRRGLLQMREGTIEPVAAAGFLASETVWTIDRLHDGRLVIGTSKGLYLRDGTGKWQPVDIAGVPGPVIVRGLLEEPDGTIWLATDGHGIVRWTGAGGRAYDTRSGMVSDTLFSVLDDGAGNLWVSSARGIARVRQSELDDFDQHRVAFLNPMVFGRSDGLLSGSTSGNGTPSAVRLKDGRILTATDNGIAVIAPDAIQPNHEPPNVVVESAVADDRPLRVGSGITVPAGTNRLEIGYTALSLIAPHRLRFRYQLQGSDPGWVDARDKRSATYTHLAPGDYTFRVLACNNDGVWNDQGTSIGLTVEPRFYQTLAFRFAVLLLLLGTTTAALTWRNRRVKFRQAALARANAELDQRVRERTAELEASKAELEQTHQRLMEASRLTGMAEVATGILHNVGNVLNSVNVSAGVLIAGIKENRLDGLAKLSALLREHAENPAQFLANDPRGRRIIPYLDALAEHARTEQQRLLREIRSLRANIDHIAEIVSRQQSLARRGGLLEKVSPVELMDDAVVMNTIALNRNAVQVRRDYGDARPLLVTERHKVMQILINLIQNANEALRHRSESERHLDVRVHVDAGHARFEVSDNGIGIAPENLPRIFELGFTTRPNGHGFGLHSSINSARQLNGKLTVHSGGIGQGATFVLILPLETDAGGAHARATPPARTGPARADRPAGA
ncbi:MAG TPA: two-component regulator propeller domain-containing protein [Opitutaceae bacterium]|nr:two-component regulator propeller domain-containing protein [Opitutaceae bacterium]